MNELQVGDRAPDFTLPDATGTPHRLADFGPGKVIVYFYPAAMTPGCTTEAVDFTAAAPAFAAAGYRIVGISPDQPAKLGQFAAQANLTIPLLADPDHQVLEAYGAWGERVLYGKRIIGVIRATFVVDVDAAGQASVIQTYYRVKATGHVDRLRQELAV